MLSSGLITLAPLVGDIPGVPTIVYNRTAEGREAIRDRARSSAERFGEREFETGWIRAMEALVK